MTDSKKYTSKLSNSRVLIIGGSSGLGFAVAEACLESGALVAISSSNPHRINTAIEKLQSSYPSAVARIHGIPVDLSKPETLDKDLERLFQVTMQKIGGEEGKLDHVVFTAADALSMMKIEELTPESIVKAGQMRFVAPLMTAKYCFRYLVPSHKSSYTITTGAISEKPVPNWSIIASYAGGHHSMVRNLALDLKPVRVNGVSPGVVDTELWRMGKEDKDMFLRECEEHMCTRVAGQPEDVAESFLVCLRD
ncbi:NAD(P)-binding protein [Lindgomyces ingoldianus]|uniref:NAD(P)-binding protein n=1 Tax=Lindgomyces ingoldianus TaxID=673940 RepID=A0ACB6QRA7_9PLEO|nr:NAD(P)-binding protein [Lindgomyces ingoldianus]KAF2469397.1 NAD(P)-binding protein [Lindgomyces ingoldianus]